VCLTIAVPCFDTFRQLHVHVELDVGLSVGKDEVDLSCVPFVDDGKDEDQAN
jgi:hypothetical protein